MQPGQQHQQQQQQLAAAGASPRQGPTRMPRDAVAVTMILRSLGIEECEPRVVPQLIEFVHKYTADVLQDAQVYADHAASARAASSSTSSSSTSNTGAGAQSASSAAAGITKDDVQLAIQSRLNFAHLDSSGPMAAIKQFADERNKMPLPELREAYGVRLPLDKYTLTGTNFHVTTDQVAARRAAAAADKAAEKAAEKAQAAATTTAVTAQTDSVSVSQAMPSASINANVHPTDLSMTTQQQQQQQQQQSTSVNADADANAAPVSDIGSFLLGGGAQFGFDQDRDMDVDDDDLVEF